MLKQQNLLIILFPVVMETITQGQHCPATLNRPRYPIPLKSLSPTPLSGIASTFGWTVCIFFLPVTNRTSGMIVREKVRTRAGVLNKVLYGEAPL